MGTPLPCNTALGQEPTRSLISTHRRGMIRLMSDREIAIDRIRLLPDDPSLQDIVMEIEFVVGIREGFEQLERGESGFAPR